MKSTKILLTCLTLLVSSDLAAEKKSEWISSDFDSIFKITMNTEHLVQSRSITYLPELPVTLDEFDSYTITLEFESKEPVWNTTGIVFGGNEGDYHILLINSSEKWFTYASHKARDLGANWRDYIFRLGSDAIDSSENEIQVVKKSQNIYFYINGKRVGQSKLPELAGNRIGFYVNGEKSLVKIKSIALQTR
ncbi:hypothetical protein [Coraliomargarita sinensis]|nr:hypothetical protein [Coraliomargarita sinensis]